ncbi:MAG: hypothetical protein WDZ69_03115 [Candidatus Pacearchaeota archaeon]
MGILEQVTGLKERGASEDEIVKTLKNQGVSPNEISEALNQAKIKNAVSSEQSEGGEGKQEEGMTPSMMGTEESTEESGAGSLPTEHISDEDLTPPTPSKSGQKGYQPGKRFKSMTREVSEEPKEGSQEDYVPRPQPQQAPQQYSGYQDQGQYSPEYQDYQGQDYGDSSYYGQDSSDNIIEISEQVFSEKIKDIQKQVNGFNEFKILTEEKIENISDRLKRIESSIDRLQAEILEKVGSYGRGLESVKKEMGMMQDSFGKVVNTLADKAEEKHSHTSRHSTHSGGHTKHASSHSKKKSTSKKKSKK